MASDISSGNQPSSSSGEDSADSTSSADYSYSEKSSGKLSNGMSSLTNCKPFTGLMSDKQSNSDSDGTCAIAAQQESHITNSASQASNRCVKKPFVNTQNGYHEFISVHKKIAGRYSQQLPYM